MYVCVVCVRACACMRAHARCETLSHPKSEHKVHYSIFKLVVLTRRRRTPYPAPGPHGQDGSPYLQVQDYPSPVALVSVCLDAVDPGALEEMPEGWVSRDLTARDGCWPLPGTGLWSQQHDHHNSGMGHKKRNSHCGPSVLRPMIPSSLECVPFLLSLSYHRYVQSTRSVPGTGPRTR